MTKTKTPTNNEGRPTTPKSRPTTLEGRRRSQQRPKSEGSARLNIYMSETQQRAYRGLLEVLTEANGGKRISAGVMFARMLNVYVAHLLEKFVEVEQFIEAGYLPEGKRRAALRRALKPEVEACLRAGGSPLVRIK